MCAIDMCDIDMCDVPHWDLTEVRAQSWYKVRSYELVNPAFNFSLLICVTLICVTSLIDMCDLSRRETERRAEQHILTPAHMCDMIH